MVLLLTACVPPIPEPAAQTAPLDPGGATPTEVCWIELATGTLPHGTVVAHHALDHDVPSTQSGILVKHPQGTWLIDLGASSTIDAEVKEVHGIDRLLLGQAKAGWTYKGAPKELVGVPLAGTIATHAHFDHLGALLELDAPVWIGAPELAWTGFGTIPAASRALATRAHPIPFTATPFLFWDQSWDVFGDGSVVVVAMPGHTPGSVGVRVRLPTGKPVFLVGDTVWVKEGYEARQQKGWIASAFDVDHDLLGTQIGRLWMLHRQAPELTILPSHDRRVWEQVFGKPGC